MINKKEIKDEINQAKPYLASEFSIGKIGLSDPIPRTSKILKKEGEGLRQRRLT